MKLQVIQLKDILLPSRGWGPLGKVPEIKESITEIGLINPITVDTFGEQFRLWDGLARYLAYRQLGKTVIEARVHPLFTPGQIKAEQQITGRVPHHYYPCCLPLLEEVTSYQIEHNPEGWSVNGCCGGGCFILDNIHFCPFCGKKLA